MLYRSRTGALVHYRTGAELGPIDMPPPPTLEHVRRAGAAWADLAAWLDDAGRPGERRGR